MNIVVVSEINLNVDYSLSAQRRQLIAATEPETSLI